MRIEEWNQLHAVVADATHAVLRSAGVAADRIGTVPIAEATWAKTLSIIGLGGKLRGSLVLSVPNAVLAQSHPTGGKDENELTDWLAELTNLILGRIKRELLAYGITTELSTPVLISATAFRFERFRGAPAVHGFAVGDERIYAIFEAVAEDGVALSATRDPALASPGDIITF